MKIYFKEWVTFKKIIQSIEKLQTTKEVLIDIDSENPIFDDLFLWRFMMNVISSRWLNVKFVANSKKSKEYLITIWANVVQDKVFILKQFLTSLNNFFLTAKEAQVWLFEKKNYFSYIIVMVEIISVLYLFYWFYSFIKPSADIYIKPSYTMDEVIYNFRFYPSNSEDKYLKSKYITSPYYDWELELNYSMLSEVENIAYSQIPSKWKVRIVNDWNKDYSLIANTTFVTQDWLVFKAKHWFHIPANKDMKASVEVELEADVKDERWEIMWARWNIKSWTKLHIRKLNDSFYKDIVYWIAITDFQWWKRTWDWSISQNDINILTWKMLKYIDENKRRLLVEGQKDINQLILPFSDTISLSDYSFSISWSVWDKVDVVNWTINAKVSYKYLKRDEFESWIMSYLEERKSDVADLLEISRSSVLFYEKEMVWKIMVVPTKIEAIWWYDFEKDVNWIKSSIINNVVWLTKNDAQELILQNSEIDFAVIEINPPWYNLVPALKSRIKVHLTQ